MLATVIFSSLYIYPGAGWTGCCCGAGPVCICTPASPAPQFSRNVSSAGGSMYCTYIVIIVVIKLQVHNDKKWCKIYVCFIYFAQNVAFWGIQSMLIRRLGANYLDLQKWTWKIPFFQHIDFRLPEQCWGSRSEFGSGYVGSVCFWVSWIRIH